MIKYIEDTVFNSPAESYVNTVNCDGFMGKGIALEFMLRYPSMYEDYKKRCIEKKINVGKIEYYNIGSNNIINFPTKKSFKFPSNIKWIEEGLEDFVKTYKGKNIKSVAFPKLGCGNGGLEWTKVKVLMEKYLQNIEIDIYICMDRYTFAKGKEKEMLDLFNEMTIDNLKNIIRVTAKQEESILNSRPLNRFYKIQEIEGLGIKSYEKLFEYFYNCSNNLKQISFFDI